MVFNLKLYSQIYEDIKNYIIAHQSRVTDFNTGSVISSQIEAFASELALAYVEARAGFSEVVLKLPFSIFDIPRNEAQRATGSVMFSRILTVGDITIPPGTQVATAAGILYETMAAATMLNGVGSVSVAIQAVDAGKTGNVAPGAINTIISGVNGVDSVVNAANVGGGVDEETVSEYLSRFRAYLMGLGKSNRYGVIFGALLNERLRSASVVEHFPPKSGIYNFTLYLDDGSGTVDASTIAAVKAVVDGNGTEAKPGYRAAGINGDYLAPSVVPIDVTADIYITYAIGPEVAKLEIDLALSDYLNAHIIGQDVIRAQLHKILLGFPWVLDLDMTAPAGNVAISDGQIARVGTITINYIQVA